jgi:hypothetical protein
MKMKSEWKPTGNELQHKAATYPPLPPIPISSQQLFLNHWDLEKHAEAVTLDHLLLCNVPTSPVKAATLPHSTSS